VSQLGLPAGRLVSKLKNFPKTDQVEKFDQRQKPAKWAQLLAAGLKFGRSVDSSGPGATGTRSFTTAAFPATLFALFYHLGTSCYSCLSLAKPLL
jgi:hypothetical protein